MAEIIIYTANRCAYCSMAKQLLAKKGVSYIEKNISSEAVLRQEMVHKSKCRTVPQIYIDDFHVGGFDDLYALEMKKELNALLGMKSIPLQ